MQNQKIVELFTAALELEETEREEFLRGAQFTPEIRKEVSRLLAAHEAAGDFLESTDSRKKAALVGFTENETRTGSTFGPYTVTRELGRGGMGVVFLAERKGDDFQQRVALKIIRGGPTTTEIHQRFLRERRILAGMEHPGIARLLDGGITDEGVPYFAMEYVEGEPITDYCDRNQLDLKARLSLFVEVCRTVQYAHGRLIVHRDLKPTNILVTPQGKTRLLDFGIAKLLEEGEDTEPLTRQGHQALTPGYAAPEQVRDEPITTATDVYSLGILLYHLLTGRLPYSFRGKNSLEWAVMVCETLPQAPSTVLDHGMEDDPDRQSGPSTLGLPQNFSLVRWSRLLQGDLDTITLKALRKEPSRRYVSAEALADDLERYLQGLPVKARTPTIRYRASRFIHRHRLGVLVAAFLLISLTLGLAGTAWQASVAARERDRATLEAQKAEEVKDFVISLFEASNPAESKGAEITARELLDRGAERIEEELSVQPTLQAEMLEVIGGVNLSLGEYPQAEAFFLQALDLRQSIHDPPAVIALTTRRVADAKQVLGQYEEAETLYRKALGLQRKELGSESPEVGQTLNDLAVTLAKEGKFREAKPIYQESLAIQRQFLGEEHPDTIQTIANLGTLYGELGDYEAAERTFRETLALCHKVFGGDHPRTTTELSNLATVLSYRGHYEEAEKIHRETLEAKRRILGPDHPDLGTTLNNLAVVMMKQGHFAEAEPLNRQVLALDRQALGEQHLWVAFDLDNLAAVVREQGRLTEALELLLEAEVIFHNLGGPESTYSAVNQMHQGVVQHYDGHLSAAENLFKKSLDALLINPGPQSPRVATTLNHLGAVYRDQERYPEAHDTHHQALLIQQAALREDHPDFVLSLVGLGEALAGLGRRGEAEKYLREAQALGERALPATHWRNALIQSALGEILAQKGSGDGLSLLKSGFEGLRAVWESWHPATQRAHDRLIRYQNTEPSVPTGS